MLTETFQARFDTPAEALQACGHCGLPVPPHRRTDGESSFCCAGCETVHALLLEAGLDGYYSRLGSDDAGVPATTTGRSYAEFDDERFVADNTRRIPGGLCSARLHLSGLHCSACVWLVERAPRILPGMVEARVDLPRALVQVVWDPSETTLAGVARALDSLGYAPYPAASAARERAARLEDRDLLLRVGVAGAAAGNAMLLAFALYSGEAASMAAEHEALFRWASLIVSVPAVLWAGQPFFRGAFAALRTRAAHMDLPVALGLLVALGSGTINTLRGRGEIFFDSATALVFLLLVGRLLQRRVQRKSEIAADVAQCLSPRNARVVTEGASSEVPWDAVVPGSLVEVRSGEQIPVDGVVVDGASTVDTSLLTGEPEPRRVQVPDEVHAGTTNLSSRLLLRADRVGAETRVAEIVQAVQDALLARAPVVELANRVAGYFVLVVLGLAVITFAYWGVRAPSEAVDNVVALLVVSCPCALGLATPLALTAALSRGARQGVLVKSAAVLEALARPGTVVLDKTGTLTEGRYKLLSYRGAALLRTAIAAVEEGSNHPVARAIGETFGPSSLAVSERRDHPSGVEGIVRGRRVAVGTLEHATARFGTAPEWVRRAVEAAARQSATPVVASDGLDWGVLALGDALRPEAGRTLEALQRMGHRLVVLSGDRPEVVRQVASGLEVRFDDIVGGASPEDKLAYVTARSQEGPVFMIGDGVNDAAALARATVGIAVHGGADASLAAANVFLRRSGLQPVLGLFVAARRALGVVRRNVLLSLGYNVVAAGLAIAGAMPPLLAAVLMPLSSLTVITSSFRARTFEEAP